MWQLLMQWGFVNMLLYILFRSKVICEPDTITVILQNVSLKKTTFAFTVALSFEVCLKELYYISFKQPRKYKFEPVILSYCPV